MFLPKNHFKESAGFSNLEYGLMAEYLGKSFIASEATNCAAPDTGNMEVLAKYGTKEQKAQWLGPLLDGNIRSAFLMTEPQVASSDALNIEFSMKKDGDYWILDGQVRFPDSLRGVRSHSRRNGGLVVLAIIDVSCISSWGNRIRTTPIPIRNIPSSLCRRILPASQSSVFSQSSALTMRHMVTRILYSTMFASTKIT